MHLEILLEELSAEAALNNLLPKLIPNEHTWNLHVFNGKTDLLDSLEGILKAYSKWITAEFRIVILVDRDHDDCLALKSNLNTKATDAGLVIKSNAIPFQVLNRIAIEELEAWFLGDPNAIRAAYPKVAAHFEKKAAFRDCDAIKGGTWEALERLLKGAGYYSSGLPKIETARMISTYMNPAENRSESFRAFVEGLNASLMGG
jgi:hypothetical protein